MEQLTNFERKKEVLRYLAYKNQELDRITHELIDESMIEISSIAKERYLIILSISLGIRMAYT